MQVLPAKKRFVLHVPVFIFRNLFVITQVAAEQEEARIRQAQAEKEAKLKKFREDVKNRVRLMEKARKQKELEKSYNAVSSFFLNFKFCTICAKS